MLVMCVDGRQGAQTALMIAAEHGHAAVCEALIKGGADVKARAKVASSPGSCLVPVVCRVLPVVLALMMSRLPYQLRRCESVCYGLNDTITWCLCVYICLCVFLTIVVV